MTRVCAAGRSLVLAGSLLLANGCAHISNYAPAGSPTATPTGTVPTSPGATPTPNPSPSGQCANSERDPNATIVVSIDPDFAAASTMYGSIFGYAEYDPTGSGTLPATAATITATTSDLLVFANYDPGTITHSAVGFPGASSFPAEPYTFPVSDASPVASTISNGAWSTGPLASFGNTSAMVCYSQTFTLPATGTFYFGDDPLYNGPSSFRGVIVVSP